MKATPNATPADSTLLEIKKDLRLAMSKHPRASSNDLVSALMLVAYEQLAATYSAEPDPEERALIMKNYPEATDALIDERAMTELGVLNVFSAGQDLMNVANDYSDKSMIYDFVQSDQKFTSALSELTESVMLAYQKAVASGVTPFGAYASTVINLCVVMRNSRLHPFQLLRPLVDGMSVFIEMQTKRLESDPSNPFASCKTEEEAIQLFSQFMGVTLATGKRLWKKQKAMAGHAGHSRWD